MPLIKVSVGNSSHKYQFDANTTCKDLVHFIHDKSAIDQNALQLYIGYPPNLITSSNIESKLSDVGIENGMVVSVRSGLPCSFCGTSDESTVKPAITRKCIDADNSCLFNAINYCKNKILNDSEQTLRHIVATEILTNATDVYGLELSPTAYAEWILDISHWGGETELHILSQSLQLEIAVVDIRTTNIYVYGENRGYSERIYILYDGVHYDALVETSCESERSVFDPTDTVTFSACQQFAQSLQEQQKFINLSGCTMKCLVCGIGLVGQKDAVEHAKKTNHQSFGQV